MAQLKDTSINGNLNVTGNIFHNGTDLNELFMPLSQDTIKYSTRWKNDMLLTLSGGQIQGSVKFNGSTNVSLEAKIVADAHSHSHNNLVNSISVVGSGVSKGKGLTSETDWALTQQNPVGKEFVTQNYDYIEPKILPDYITDTSLLEFKCIDYYNNYFCVVFGTGNLKLFCYITKDLNDLGEPIDLSGYNHDPLEIQHTSKGFYLRKTGDFKWTFISYDRNVIINLFDGVNLTNLLNTELRFGLNNVSGPDEWYVNEKYRKIIFSLNNPTYTKTALVCVDLDTKKIVFSGTFDGDNETCFNEYNNNSVLVTLISDDGDFIFKIKNIYIFSFENLSFTLKNTFSEGDPSKNVYNLPHNRNALIFGGGLTEGDFTYYDIESKKTKVVTGFYDNTGRKYLFSNKTFDLIRRKSEFCYHDNKIYLFGAKNSTNTVAVCIFSADGINWYKADINSDRYNKGSNTLLKLFPISLDNGIVLFSTSDKMIKDNTKFYYVRSGDITPTQMNLHHHDERYYTIQEINTILTTLGSSGSSLTLTNYYTKADIDTKLKGYALSGHTHSNYITTTVANNTYAQKDHYHTWEDGLSTKPKSVNTYTSDSAISKNQYLVTSPSSSLNDTYPVCYSKFQTNLNTTTKPTTDGIYYDYTGFNYCQVVFNGEYFITVNTSDKTIYYSERLDQMLNKSSITLQYVPDRILYNKDLNKVIFVGKINDTGTVDILNGSSPDNWTLTRRYQSTSINYTDNLAIDTYEEGLTITVGDRVNILDCSEDGNDTVHIYKLDDSVKDNLSLIRCKIIEIQNRNTRMHVIATIHKTSSSSSLYFNVYQRNVEKVPLEYGVKILPTSMSVTTKLPDMTQTKGLQIITTDLGFLKNKTNVGSNLSMQVNPEVCFSIVNYEKKFGSTSTELGKSSLLIKSYYASICDANSNEIIALNKNSYLLEKNYFFKSWADLYVYNTSQKYNAFRSVLSDLDYQNRTFVKNGYIYAIINSSIIAKVSLQTDIEKASTTLDLEEIKFHIFDDLKGQNLLNCVNYFNYDGTDTIKALFFNATSNTEVSTPLRKNMIAISFGNDFYGTNRHNHDSRYVTRDEYEAFEGNVDLSKYYTKTEAEAKMDEKDKTSFTTQTKALSKMLNNSYDEQDVENYRLTSLDRMIAENDLSVLYKLNKNPRKNTKTTVFRTVTNALSGNKDLPVCGTSSSVSMSDRSSYVLEPMYKKPKFEYNVEYDFYYIKSSPASYPDLGMHFYSASSEDSCIDIYRDSILSYRDKIIKEKYSDFGCSSFDDAVKRIFYTDGKIEKNYLYLTMYIGSYTKDSTTNKYTWSSTGNKFFIFRTEILSIDKINGFILDSSYEWYGFDTTEISSFSTSTLISTDNIITSGTSYYLAGSGTKYLNADSIVGCFKYCFEVLLGDIATKENSRPFIIYNATDKKTYLIAANGSGTVDYYSINQATSIDYSTATDIPYSSYFIYNLKLEKTEDIFISDGEVTTFNYYTAHGAKSKTSTIPTSVNNYNDTWGILDLNDNVMTWIFVKDQDDPRILCTTISKATLRTNTTMKITNNIKSVIALPIPAKTFKYANAYSDDNLYDINLFPQLVKDNENTVIIAWLIEGKSLVSHMYRYGWSLYVYEHFVNNNYAPEPVNYFNLYGNNCMYNDVLIGKDKILLGSDKYDGDFSYSTPNLIGYQYEEIGGLSYEQKAFDTIASEEETGLMPKTQYTNLIKRNREAHLLLGNYIPFEPIIEVEEDLEFICENDEFSVYYSKTTSGKIVIVCNHLIDVNNKISFISTGRNANTCSITFSDMNKMNWCSYKGNIYGIINGILYKLGNYGYKNDVQINSTSIDFDSISAKVDKLFTDTSDSDNYSTFGDASPDTLHNYALYATNDNLFAIKIRVMQDSSFDSSITLKQIIIDKQITTKVILENKSFNYIGSARSIPSYSSNEANKTSSFAITKIEDIRLVANDSNCRATFLLQLKPYYTVKLDEGIAIPSLETCYAFLYFLFDYTTKKMEVSINYDFINKVSSDKIVKFIGGELYNNRAKDNSYFQIGDNLYLVNVKLYYNIPTSGIEIIQCNQILDNRSAAYGTKWEIRGKGIQDVRKTYSDYSTNDSISNVHYECDKNNDIFVFYTVNNKMTEVIRMAQNMSTDYSFSRNTLRLSGSSAFSKYLRYKNKFYLVSNNWAYESKIGPIFNPVEYPKISGKNYKLDVKQESVDISLTATLFHNDGSGLSVYSNDAYSDTINYNFRSNETMFYDKQRKVLYQISTVIEDGKTYPKMFVQHIGGSSNYIRAYKIPILLSEFASNTNLVIKQISENEIFICNKITETTNSNDGLTYTNGIYYSTKGIKFNLESSWYNMLLPDTSGGFTLMTLIPDTTKAVIEYNPDDKYCIAIECTEASNALGKVYLQNSGSNIWTLMESTDYLKNRIYYLTNSGSSIYMPTTSMTGLSLALGLKYLGNSKFLYIGYNKNTNRSIIYKICTINSAGSSNYLLVDFKEDTNNDAILPSSYYGYMFACENSRKAICYSVGTAINTSDTSNSIPTIYDITVINDEFYTVVSNIPYNYSNAPKLDGGNTLVSIYKSKDGVNWERISEIPDVKLLLTCKNTLTNAPYRMYAKLIDVDGRPCIIVRIGFDNNDGNNSWKFFTIYIDEYIS